MTGKWTCEDLSDKKLGNEKPGSEDSGDKTWMNFLRRHWQMSLLMLGGIVGAVIAAVFVFLWVVADAQATGLVPALLGLWTVGYFITFILQLIFWELVFVGTWAIPLILILYFVWYKRLPAQELEEYKGGRKGLKSTGNGDSISFFAGLIWLVIVWTEGKWNLAFQQWTLNDWVYSWIAAYLVIFVIIGIPGIIYVLWSIGKSRR